MAQEEAIEKAHRKAADTFLEQVRLLKEAGIQCLFCGVPLPP